MKFLREASVTGRASKRTVVAADDLDHVADDCRALDHTGVGSQYAVAIGYGRHSDSASRTMKVRPIAIDSKI